MSKIKFLTTLVVLLLLLIAVTLFFLLGKKDGNKHRPNNGGRPSYSEYISKKLNFDTVQRQELKDLRTKHKQELEDLRKEDKQVQEIKTQMLKDGVTDSVRIDSILSASVIVKKKFEQAFHNHFMQLRAICKPEQITLFNQMLDEMNKRRMPNFGDKKNAPKKDEKK